MENSVESSGTDKAVELGLDDLEGMAGGGSTERSEALIEVQNMLVALAIRCDKSGDPSGSAALATAYNWVEKKLQSES